MTCNSPIRLFPNESVFQARGMLSAIDPGLAWDDAIACLMAEPRFGGGGIYEQAELKVWPNPAKDHLYLHLEGSPSQKWEVELFNAFGQAVSSWRLDTGMQGIDLYNLNPGVYFLYASNTQGVRRYARFLVAH